MKRIVLFLVICLFFLSGCVTVKYLEPYAEEEGPVSVVDSKNIRYLVSDNGPFSLSVSAGDYDSGTTSFYVHVTNNSEDVQTFKATDFSLYGFNSKKGEFEPLQDWNADNYYFAAVKEVKREQARKAFAGALLIADSLFGARRYYYQRSHGHTRTYVSHVRNYANVYAAIMLAEASEKEAKASGQAYLEFLKSSMLYNAVLEPGETYGGWIFFNDSLYKDYYMLVYRPGEDETRFVFIKREV